MVVAKDELGIVEVVAGVHAHRGRQLAAQPHLALRVEQGHLDAVDPAGMLPDERQYGFRGIVQIGRSPVPGQPRVERLAQPVQHHRHRRLRDQLVVDAQVVVVPASGPGQLPAAHEHRHRAGVEHVGQLLLVGPHSVHNGRIARRQLVGADAGQDRPADGPGLGAGPSDEFPRGRVVEPHPALSRVHRLGHPEAVPPQVMAEPQGRLPVHCGRCAGDRLTERVGHHMRGRERDPAAEGLGRWREAGAAAQVVPLTAGQ